MHTYIFCRHICTSTHTYLNSMHKCTHTHIRIYIPTVYTSIHSYVHTSFSYTLFYALVGAKLSTEHDSVSQFFSCNDHDSVLFITDRSGWHILIKIMSIRLTYLLQLVEELLTAWRPFRYRSAREQRRVFHCHKFSRFAGRVEQMNLYNELISFFLYILTVHRDETVTSVFPVDKFGVDEFLVLAHTYHARPCHAIPYMHVHTCWTNL